MSSAHGKPRRGALDGIRDVPGVRTGHATDREGLTGCTAVLFDEPAVVGVDVRGSAPGTRETARLAPTASVRDTHALLLTGGSAFGLAAADGVARLLEEQGRGLDLGVARIPLVSAAVIFDLMAGSASARPDAAMGYEAALSARGGDSGKLERGSVGAGTGATVGKVLGLERAMKGGVGEASTVLEGGATVAALAVVNAFGDVRDSGAVIAGPRLEDGTPGDTVALLERSVSGRGWGENTTLGVVVTDARLDKIGATKVSQMAHDGLARAVWPVHTGVDGDVVFSASLGSGGEHEAATDVVGAWAAWAMQEAILDAVGSATGVQGLPGLGDRGRAGMQDSGTI